MCEILLAFSASRGRCGIMAGVKKRTIQISVTLILSAVALYIALKGVDFTIVGRALRQVLWGWLVLTLILIFGTLVIRAQRWRILLGNQLSFRDAFGLINIGYLISGVLPLRAGDPARAVGANLRGPISVLSALSTVAVERVLDLFIMFILLLVTLPFVPGLQAYLVTGQTNGLISYQLILVISGLLALTMLVIFVLLALIPEKIENLSRKFLVPLHLQHPDRWIKPLHNILIGFNSLRSPRASFGVIFWSIALWIVTALYFTTAMMACSVFIPHTSLLQSTVAMWASAFGMVFPATGGIGSFHFAVREALAWGFDIQRDMGFTYAVIVHAIPYLTGIILGTVSVLLWGISLRSLVGMAAEPDKV
jgi:uncharacterized protein (TIRG00374 family)